MVHGVAWMKCWNLSTAYSRSVMAVSIPKMRSVQ
ncbi:Uncharacterised protein [Vibrio cholerae]|nr:Uncharacterised protein [Vibrio cholerae]